MDKCAVFTIEKDERFHLPQWLKYYRKNFAPEDIYILDHNSEDPEVLEILAHTDVNVVKVSNDKIFDHQWLLDTVHAFQRDLLEKYDYVLFTDCDEIIIPAKGTLQDFKPTKPIYRCTGYELVEGQMCPAGQYNKTLLSSEPLIWVNGYHQAQPEIEPDGELFLYHLHRMDYGEAWQKNLRWSKKEWDPAAISGGLQVQGQITEEARFREWFYNTGPLEDWHERITKELKPKCTIVIPVFGPEHYLTACLKALEENTEDYELIVVDNGTGYRTDCFTIRNPKNLGFGVACNQGATRAASDYICFLNMDTEVQPNWLPPLLGVADIAGGRLVHPDGSLDGCGMRTWHGNGNAGATAIKQDIPTQDVDGIGGACMVIRRELFNELGQFDTHFHNGYEDVDLCLQAKEKGYTIRFVAESTVIHHESVTGPERWKYAEKNVKLMDKKWGNR